MFQFRDVQRIDFERGGSLLKEAGLTFSWYPKGGELRIERDGRREISVSLNSKPFVYELKGKDGNPRVMIGFGSVDKKKETLSVFKGRLSESAANELCSGLVLPEIQMPTIAVFIERPFASEKAIVGVQFIDGVPMRELKIDVEDQRDLDRDSFRAFCHKQLGIPESPRF